MVLWNGVNFTADGREPATADEFYQIGLRCWKSSQYRPAAPFFLEHAAVAGHALAAEFLGHVCFLQGDHAKAVPWLRRSTASPRAGYYLGCLCQRGFPEAGIAQSFDAAAQWYRHAVSLGEPEAMLALGDLYLERLLPVSRAPMAHALEYFLLAAGQGHSYGAVPGRRGVPDAVRGPRPCRAVLRAVPGQPRPAQPRAEHLDDPGERGGPQPDQMDPGPAEPAPAARHGQPPAAAQPRLPGPAAGAAVS
ncbi:tetratricopeptide repeat protein [Actinacidiphila sp. ITFR-21]|uniref:tetratricopeptide repeat protein n=1 Tax=Actinacidiphila sp. ITFR-21 TaxID=3075199 RepID=UPI00288B2B89|nr:hypothetical protein [Streptomyces sp. ITFR-21]WNI18842.1 hypothetical protein RLT57_27155 [Streptomyces sp. ITFR-21]